MNPEKRTARIAGILIILALASSLTSGNFLDPLIGSDRPQDYLDVVSANEIQVLIGVLLLLTLTVSVVAIPIVMFPILKPHNESLALGYVGARIFEGFSDFIIAISPLLLVALSQEFVNATVPVPSHFETAGALLLALRDWVGILENVPYSLGVLIFSYLLYQSKLVPRWLAVWGLIGGTIMLTRVPISMFILDPLSPYHEWTALLAIPIIVNELVLAVWFIIKGFNPIEE